MPAQSSAWDNLASPTSPTGASSDPADGISGFSDLGIFEKNSKVVEKALHHDHDGLAFEALTEAKTDDGGVLDDNGSRAEPEKGSSMASEVILWPFLYDELYSESQSYETPQKR